MSERRIHALDLVRGAAAFAVAIPHFLIGQNVHPALFEAISIYGVEIFFVLSGFVLAPQLQICYEMDRGTIYWRFLVRRWMRTVPPYLFALILFTLAFDYFISDDFVRYVLFLQNLTGVAVANDFFQISWSLSVEEWFYIAFPLTIALASRLPRRLRPSLLQLAILFIAAFLIHRTFFGDFTDWGPQVRRVVVFRLDSIGLGVLLYLIGQRVGRFTPAFSFVFTALALAAAARVMYVIMAGDGTLPKHLFFFAASALGAGFIMLAVSLEPQLRKVKAAVIVADYLGKISYSTYLFHLLVIFSLGRFTAGMDLPARFAIFLALLAVVATSFYYLVEEPILRHRPSLRPRRDFGAETPQSGAASITRAPTSSAAGV
jgi:peptidoglycan/LPS O-acetylase OafA/YrhL